MIQKLNKSQTLRLSHSKGATQRPDAMCAWASFSMGDERGCGHLLFGCCLVPQFWI